MQAAAHYAAKTNIKRNLRKAYSPPTAEEILEQASRPYQETGCGDLPFLLHIGPRRVFVSKNFVAFGASQQGIGQELGISRRSVQRHQQALSLERRQVMQSKADYGRVRHGIGYASFYSPDPTLELIACGNDYILSEHHQARSAKSKPYSRVVTKESFCNYYDKWWIYRCNVYASPFRLCSMRAARKYFLRGLPPLVEAKQGMSQAEIQAFNFAAADPKIENFNLENFQAGPSAVASIK